MVVVVSVVAVVMQTYFQQLSHQLLYTPGRYLLCLLRPCQRLCRLFLLFLLFVGLGAATPAPRWGVAEPKLVCQLCIASGHLPSLLTSETVPNKLCCIETWSWYWDMLSQLSMNEKLFLESFCVCTYSSELRWKQELKYGTGTHNPATLEPTAVQILVVTDRQTDRRTDGQTDGQTDRRTDGEKDREKDGQTDGRTDG